MKIKASNKTGQLIGKMLKEIALPEGVLVAMVNRHGDAIVPKGSTVIHEGDRLTLIGEPKGVAEFKKIYAKP